MDILNAILFVAAIIGAFKFVDRFAGTLRVF